MLPEEKMDTELANNGRQKIIINRPAYSQKEMISAYDLRWEAEVSLAERIKKCIRNRLTCTAGCWKGRLLGFFPFVEVMRTYNWRSWLVLDLISGISMSVVHIPQGMGFALLTSVPPVYGLYSSFFPPLIYFFFGTSRHLSMGTMALVSLMIGSTVNREVERRGLAAIPLLGDNSSANPTNRTVDVRTTTDDDDDVKVAVAVSISLLVGCIQFLMGVVGLGSVATFMSMPFIGSFLTAAAVHIIASQVPAVLGLTVDRRSGLLTLPLTFESIFRRIDETNLASLVIGLTSLVVLVVLKNGINERCRSRMKAPIPAELIVVVIGILTSHYLRVNDVYGTEIIGAIPTGIPPPRLPPMTDVQMYIVDSVIIATISFVISISMAKLLAKKHGYAIDVNQELFAYGLSYGLSSFFGCFAGAQAPPRTLLHDSLGGKTQLSSLFSCSVVLIVCLFMGRLFYSLPVPVLAAVIIVALLPMFEQFQQLPTLWRVNKYDFFVWIITFSSAVILNITSGLVIGMATSIFFVVFQAHFAFGSTLVSLDDSDIFLTKDRLQSDRLVEYPGIQVFRFDAQLFFVNVEKFKTQLFRKTLKDGPLLQIDPYQISTLTVDQPDNLPNGGQQPDGLAAKDVTSVDVGSTELGDIPLEVLPHHGRKTANRAVILDCSAMSYVDIMGVNALKMVSSDLLKLGIRFSLACVPSTMARRLESAGVLSPTVNDRDNRRPMFTLYPSVRDAVAMEMVMADRK